MADLPSGTVTLLFTDIEGSTQRWERDSSTTRAADHLVFNVSVIKHAMALV
jgi:class 3 adenylate cyclase